MSRYIIDGRCKIEGEITASGAKNGVLPALSAALLTNEDVYIHNCPDIRDVRASLDILQNFGCKATLEDGIGHINCSAVTNCSIPEYLMHEMRSSIIFLGSLLARFHTAQISYPGGCELGPRPIDLHIMSLEKMGVVFENCDGGIKAYCDKLTGCDIQLDFPSVGATENIMLAATLADGKTVIHNAAREPEIEDLQILLNKMGAKIFGAGSNMIEIIGVEKLHSTHHNIVSDRIVTATYLTAAAMTGGEILVRNINREHINSVTDVLAQTGARVTYTDSTVHLKASEYRKAVPTVRTMPYPGFPTDALACAMSYACVCQGTTVFIENIFQNRFRHVDELIKMGADIKCENRIAVVRGIERLAPARMTATDLRGGAAMVLAAMCADGRSSVDNIELIERGYENFDRKLQALGCKIRKEL